MNRTIDQLLELDPRLRRLAGRLAADPHDAEDLVQDVWIAALSEWPGDGCELEPWAVQVLRNAAAKRARRLRPAALEPGAEPSVLEPEEPRTPAERLELEERLRACIESLPEPYRGTVIERYYAARSVGDIAAGRGIPRATVSTHLRRALERLRARLGRARDVLALAPAFRARLFARRLAELAPRGGRLLAGGVAALCAVPSIAVAVAWARSSAAHPERATLAAQDPERAAGRTAAEPEGAASARTPLFAEPVAQPLLAEARDELTSAPLADRALVVWDEHGLAHERRTDADGRFALPSELAAQWITAALADGSASEPSFRRFARAEDGVLRLVLAEGPHVRARFDPPPGLHPAELVCGLRSKLPGSLTSRVLAVGPGERASEWTVQLPAEWRRITDLRDVALHVETPDGLAAGDARITEAALALREVLELELEPRAALELALDGWPTAIANSAVRIAPAGSERAWVAAPTAAGRALVGGLAPGAYRLSVHAAGAEPWTRDVELAGGVRERLTARLEASGSGGGALRGAILAPRDGYDGAIVVALEGGSAPQYARARWTDTEDGRAAVFEFHAALAEHPVVRPIALDGLPSFDPPFLEPRAGEPATFTCRGERQRTAAACDVRAAGTLAALEELELEFELAGGTRVHYRRLAPAEGEPARWAVSCGSFRWKVRAGEPWDWIDPAAEVRWTLEAPGCAAARGDHTAWSSGAFRVELAPAAVATPVAGAR